MSALALDLPEGWDPAAGRIEAVYYAPPREDLPTSPQLSVHKQRYYEANMQVSRQRSGADTETAVEELVAAMSRFPSLKVVRDGAIQFADGAAGRMVTLSFEPAPAMPVIQRNAFRVDEDVITQLTATTSAFDRSLLEGPLTKSLLAFSPGG